MLIKPDPATPAGEAIIDLADLMDGLQERTGEWPGADTVDIVEGWLSRFTFAVPEDLTTQVVGRTWVLRQWDRHTDDVTLWSNEASALASLAQEVRSSWDDVGGTDGVPYRPPADDQAAVDLYYGPEKNRGDAGYTLYPDDISRHVRVPLSLSLSDAEACAEANSSALFHPQGNPDDEGLPCIEIAGILVFAYLDADRGTVRVSVHLDTTHEQLVRTDGTVPIQVEIEDATVFDNLAPPPALPEPTGWKDRIRRLTRRTAPFGSGKLRQGVDHSPRNTII
ncbi:hypothetical protein [Streptomyces malaysiensis]|uniref:Uncharacterized protein n=1 Tax=Streptomyces malaysiensis subsp. samsunensis TaxID=459658 RepID=A0A9X2M5I1_STRMQ|nr:hypothetical protein [Streptomyces samsunensis]MCQ8836116.1 hypothetical protein [Streptomyces samsunensis]